MSIAVSVVIQPSRLALVLVGAICLGSALIGIVIGFGRVGELAPAMRYALAGACVIIGFGVFYYAMRAGKAHHIDISGIGQMRLAETTAVADPASNNARPDSLHVSEVVSLKDDSTLWPFLLVLRLENQEGRARTVIVLPDSVDRAGFRALSVACRWIFAHSGRNATVG